LPATLRFFQQPASPPNLGDLGVPNLGCNPSADCEKALVVFVGGAGDTKNLNMYSAFIEYCKAQHPHQAKAYFTNDGSEQIARYIAAWRQRFPGHQTGLVGHSFGGWASYRAAQLLAEKGIPLDLLVTLDPVTKTNFERRNGFEVSYPKRPFERPKTTGKWYNVFVKDDPNMPVCSTSKSNANRIARIGGGSWNDLKQTGLVDDEWSITSALDIENSVTCHNDNGHALTLKLLAPVYVFIRSIK
jgi:pimeloyl-ACP methyl ester carboxylesterase